MALRESRFFNNAITLASLQDCLIMLDPRIQFRNPVMFVVYICAIGTTLYLFHEFSWFNFQIWLWLWLTVFFANFAQSLAQSQGVAHASCLRKTKLDTYAQL